MRSTVPRQVLRGVQMVGIGFLCLLCVGALLDGFRRLSSEGHSEAGAVGNLVGLIELVAVAVVLWRTASAWARWVAPASFFFALKSLIGIVAGAMLSHPYMPVSRLIAAELFTYLFSAGLLSLRFVSHQPRMLERAALIVFILSTCGEMSFEPSSICLLVGLVSLAGARLASMLTPRSHDKLA